MPRLPEYTRATAAQLAALIPSDTGRDETWQEQALCASADPEQWFPEKGGSSRDAKRICGRCPVREECLEYALTWDERFGVWGGKSERERKVLRQQRATEVSQLAVAAMVLAPTG